MGLTVALPCNNWNGAIMEEGMSYEEDRRLKIISHNEKVEKKLMQMITDGILINEMTLVRNLEGTELVTRILVTPRSKQLILN